MGFSRSGFPLVPLSALLAGAVSACSPAEPAGGIHEAVKSGEVTLVTSLLAADSTVIGSRDEDGRTPLHLAVREGHQAVTELLLEMEADVGARDAEERTPLHDAADAGDAEAVRLLLAHGSDVMAREFRGRTPLFLACNWGNDLEVVRLLVEAGADVNDRTPTRGEEILFSTLFYGRQDIIDFLLDNGARLPDDDDPVVRAVYISASNGRERIFQMAVELAEARGLTWWEEVPVHAAARGGSVSIGEALLAVGGEPDGKNLYGVTPLHVAAENGCLEFVDFLLDRGARVDEPSRSGLTALHFATDNGHQEVVSRLNARGASQSPRVFPELRGSYLGEPEPEGEPRRFALGIVSGHGFDSEHSPAVFSPDGTEVYWTAGFGEGALRMRRTDGVWSAPEPAPFNTEFGEGEPFFSPDGERLYFLSKRPLGPGGTPGKENIWYIDRAEGGWSEPQPVSPGVNDFDHHWLVSVSAEGTLYFSSVREGGEGGGDIYRTRMLDGSHQEPENLGPVVNTAGTEITPYIAPDESYLIFSSTGRPGEEGEFLFFISYRDSDGTWLPPISLAEEVGPISQPLWPSITPDGRFMFFIAEGDIWWMSAEFIDRLRPA